MVLSDRRALKQREQRTFGCSASIVLAERTDDGSFDTGVDPSQIVGSGPRIIAFLNGCIHPISRYFPPRSRTFHIAFLGTVASIVFSLLLGGLIAETVIPRFIHLPVKWLLAALQAIPKILVAMLMVGDSIRVRNVADVHSPR